jgi:hypothetical protein
VKKFIAKQPDNRITEKTFKSGGILQVQGELNLTSGEKNLEAYTFLAAFQEGRNHSIVVRTGKEVQFIYVDALRKKLSKNH